MMFGGAASVRDELVSSSSTSATQITSSPASVLHTRCATRSHPLALSKPGTKNALFPRTLAKPFLISNMS